MKRVSAENNSDQTEIERKRRERKKPKGRKGRGNGGGGGGGGQTGEENQQRANKSYTICFNKSCPIRKANSAFFRIFIQRVVERKRIFEPGGEKQLAISAC